MPARYIDRPPMAPGYGGYSRSGFTLTDLMMERGRMEAEAAQQSGNLWANTIAGLGQNIGGAIMQAGEDSKRAKRDAAWVSYVSSDAWHKDPEGAYKAALQTWGPEEGPKQFQALAAASQLAGKQRDPKADLEALGHVGHAMKGMGDEARAVLWPQAVSLARNAFPEIKLPDQYDSKMWTDVAEPFLSSLEKPREGFTLKPGETRYDEAGKQIAMIPGEQKPDTRSLDQQAMDALKRNDLTEYKRIQKVKADMAAAGRDPAAAGARADAATAREQARTDSRLDRSYQFNAAELERTAKPLTEQAERFGRLAETVNQRTPQADALIAPELLTVMAGGQGSGLRMNEAEIARIVGGRSNLERLKASLNKWSLDPSKALSVTDAQRKQIGDLIGGMKERIDAKAGVINEARNALVNAKSPDDQRRAMVDFKRKLMEVGASVGGGDSGPRKVSSKAEFDALPSGTVFLAPDGQLRRKP